MEMWERFDKILIDLTRTLRGFWLEISDNHYLYKDSDRTYYLISHLKIQLMGKDGPNFQMICPLSGDLVLYQGSEGVSTSHIRPTKLSSLHSQSWTACHTSTQCFRTCRTSWTGWRGRSKLRGSGGARRRWPNGWRCSCGCSASGARCRPCSVTHSCGASSRGCLPSTRIWCVWRGGVWCRRQRHRDRAKRCQARSWRDQKPTHGWAFRSSWVLGALASFQLSLNRRIRGTHRARWAAC